MEGDHFLSDTIMSYIITYVVIRVLYDLFLPEDLNLKRKTKLKELRVGGPASSNPD